MGAIFYLIGSHRDNLVRSGTCLPGGILDAVPTLAKDDCDDAPEDDFQYHRIYRSNSPDFEPAACRVGPGLPTKSSDYGCEARCPECSELRSR